MAPIHIFVWTSALIFQVINGLSIGGWLGGYGPTKPRDWAARPAWTVWAGMAIWAAGFAGNVYHDDVLRAIRRNKNSPVRQQQLQQQEQQQQVPPETPRKRGRPRKNPLPTETQAQQQQDEKKGEEKVYQIPEGGLFKLVLHAHYFCEWIEWCGFWLVGGVACVPARNFVWNEVMTMGPRAWNGWYWYVEKFGREKVGKRKAVVPYLI